MAAITRAQDVQIKKGFEERYRELLHDDYDMFIDYSMRFLRKSIRVNPLKSSIKDVRLALNDWQLTAIPWCKHGFWVEHIDGRRDIGNMVEHALGYYYVQETASMIPVVVLDPKPGEVVLDMCAAPGSKSTQIAQQMENQGIVVCNDVSTTRIAPLSINLQRCGVKNSVVTLMQGTKFSKISQKFNRVLVDAPCSGTGAIRKSFKTLEMWNPKMVKRLAATQKKLLQTGYDVLKSRGTLVYSTCTLEPEENEGVIDWFLEKNDDAELQNVMLKISRSNPVISFEGKSYDNRVRKCLRIWPQDNDTEGFFIAEIKKGR
ncbi:RsmB/NOP family class I SAM-dependent RNA methyltransferase [Candidatus Woesearchaeota archaeon]|nr:RsmB/NOP family class I SAM-dependent RNA methyltransferase [Candidatus Woesearchaeota archaeon]